MDGMAVIFVVLIWALCEGSGDVHLMDEPFAKMRTSTAGFILFRKEAAMRCGKRCNMNEEQCKTHCSWVMALTP